MFAQVSGSSELVIGCVVAIGLTALATIIGVWAYSSGMSTLLEEGLTENERLRRLCASRLAPTPIEDTFDELVENLRYVLGVAEKKAAVAREEAASYEGDEAEDDDEDDEDPDAEDAWESEDDLAEEEVEAPAAVPYGKSTGAVRYRKG